MSGKFQRTYTRVAWRMSGKFQRTYNCAAWRMSGKFQRTCSRVAWRMHGRFQRTYSRIAWRTRGKFHGRFQRTYSSHTEACPSSASSHECKYMPHPTPPHPTPPVHTCTYRQPQRSMSFLRKCTWTLIHARPHPTRAYMHLPAATKKHVLPPQVHMNVNKCPSHPTPTLEMRWKNKKRHFVPRPCSSRCPTTNISSF